MALGRVLHRKPVGGAALVVAAAACLVPLAASASGKPMSAARTQVTCQAVRIGVVIRCQNFYKDYWPTINRNLNVLYKKALATDGGTLVDWDWYPLSADTIKAFTKRFPGIKVKTQGFTYNLSSAIISAHASGARSTDVVSGSITSMTAMYDQGYWAKIDWTKYGVPRQFLTVGAPELLPDSLNGSLIQYNTKTAPGQVKSLTEFASPPWQGKTAIASYNAQDFTGYGMKYGQAKMVGLIQTLKSQGKMTVTNDPDTLLSNGDKGAVIGGQLFSSNPALTVAPFEADNMYVQFSGVNKYAKNPAAAMLFELWNAYDPQWLKTRLTQAKFADRSLPFIGLPASVFAQSRGLIRKNQLAWFRAIKNGWAIFETQKNRDKYNALIKAADTALSK